MLFRFFTIAIALTFIVFVGGCNLLQNDDPNTKDDPTILPVKVVKVVRQSGFTYPMKFYGRIQAARQSSISFELEGLIAKVLVDEGHYVKQGDIIALLNTDVLMAQRRLLVAKKGVEESLLDRLVKGERKEVIAAARAAVERLKVESKHAYLLLQREQRLVNKKSIPEAQFEKSQYENEALKYALEEGQARLDELLTGTREEDLAAQQKRVALQEAELDVLDTRIQKATLVAPFDGQVIERMIDEGSVVDVGQPLLLISDSQKQEAHFSLPATELGDVANVTHIKVGNREIPISGSRIINNVSATTRTVVVVFDLSLQANGLLTGESCVMSLAKTVNGECVEVSIASLVPSVRGLWSCYRVVGGIDQQNFRLAKEEVTVVHTDGERVFLQTALPDDALIVKEGVQKLFPGMRVRPVIAND